MNTEARKSSWRKCSARRRLTPEVREYNRVKAAEWRRKNIRAVMLDVVKRRAEKAGQEYALTEADLDWPTHCPALGVLLIYGATRAQLDHCPSIDRWDNDKGYIPGNAYVISYRANRIKQDATAEELEAVAQYTRSPPKPA